MTDRQEEKNEEMEGRKKRKKKWREGGEEVGKDGRRK